MRRLMVGVFGLVLATAGSIGSATSAVAAAQPQIVPRSVSIVEGNAGTKVALVPVTLSAPSSKTVTASWQTLNYGAAAPFDFVAASGTVRFLPGQTRRTVAVQIKGDALDEVDETLLVQFFNPTNATIGGFAGLGAVVIVDDDAPPEIVPRSTVTFEGSAAFVPVGLSAPSSLTVTAHWTTVNHSATAPEDFVAASGTVRFRPGETFANVEILTTHDPVQEPEETLLVRFSNPTNATIGGFAGLGAAVIIDDDRPEILPGRASISEGDSGTKILSIPVTLSAPSSFSVSASWHTLGATFIGAPATPPEDFLDASGGVFFAPGQTETLVSVTINGDVVVEPNEVFLLIFENPTNASLGDNPTGVGVILNDD